MRILYIHGLDSSPNPDRIGWLERAGHRVFALHLDYRQQPDAFAILRGYAQANQIEFIVGSSLGGFLGFWLGEALGLPTLLFNPAMTMVRLDEARIDPNMPRRCPSRWVVLGAQDDTVDPFQNEAFFADPDNQVPYQRVVRCQWLGHQIDPDTFAAMARWAGLG
ncbi:MAG: alpha/beta hydrolase [Bacteroidetes bacterium]|nr:MAG: alpha/beta hydrolase [Bacteroidota bacterium]